MKNLILYLMLLSSFAVASPKNIFVIKDKDGKVLKNKTIDHIKNVYFDDLIKEQEKLLEALDKLQKKKAEIGYFDKSKMLKNAKTHLGERYVWGGTKPNAFDCSGYMQYLYKKEGVALPRTAYEQSRVGQEVNAAELQKGDLLFFLTDKSRGIPVTHVGMYLGNDKFIHAASKKKGIIISPFSKSRYAKLFVKATRIIE
jgi:hypothetical protein